MREFKNLFSFFFEIGSLCSPCWQDWNSIAQAGLEKRSNCLRLPVLELKVYAITPAQNHFFKYEKHCL